MNQWLSSAVGIWKTISTVLAVAFSPDGKQIVSGSYDKTIRIWDATTGETVAGPLEGHTEGVHSVAYSPDGKHIVSGSYDKTIRIWNTKNKNFDTMPAHVISHFGDTINSRIISSSLLKYQHDGWMSFNNSVLLFWLNSDLQMYIPIANCTLVIGPQGVSHVHESLLYIGPTWDCCYKFF